MRELIISRIMKFAELLEDKFDVHPNELATMPDDELLDLFQEWFLVMVDNGM